MKRKPWGHIYARSPSWSGAAFVLTKGHADGLHPTQIIPLRMGLAYLTLWALRPKTMKLPGRMS